MNISIKSAIKWVGVVVMGTGLMVGAAGLHQEDFVGPFSNWADVKRDFGAVGDGKADDTAALQKALDTFMTKSYVLYLPAGTYRITKGLTMTSHMFATLVGEDPAKTIIKWDGGDDGVMMLCNGVRYSKIGRITWDGSGKPVTALWHRWDGHTPNAATGLEHFDEVFRNAAFGIRAGTPHFMDAECMISRCAFERLSGAGVSIESFNALDWWVWNGRFTDCKVGVENIAEGQYGGGNFHVYQSVFRNSSDSDIKIGHTSYFGIRHNVSIGSKRFFVAGRPAFGAGAWAPEDTWGAQISLQGNTIVDSQDPTPIHITSSSSLFLLDNVIRSRAGVNAPVAASDAPGTPSIVAVGNTLTVTNAYVTSGKITDIDTKLVLAKAIPDPKPVLPPTPVWAKRRIFEVPLNATGDVAQSTINEAAKLNGKKPVVHFPSGTHNLPHTLVIPAGTDLQLVGDGQSSILQLAGPGDSALRILGPTHATLRDFCIYAGTKQAIRIEGVDQPDGLIFGDQVWAAGREYGLMVRDLKNTRVELRGTQPGGGNDKYATINVDNSVVALFGAATSGNGCIYNVYNGGKLLVRDTWFEGGSAQFLKLSDSARVTFDGCKVACLPPVPTDKPSLLADGLRGNLTLVGLNLTGNNWIAVRGDKPETKVLVLNSLLGCDEKQRYTVEGSNSSVGVVGTRRYDGKNPRGGTLVEPDFGKLDKAFLLEMLADDRTFHPSSLKVRPEGVTDLRLHRINMDATSGIEISK